MSNHDLITLPRPVFLGSIELGKEQEDRLREIVRHIEDLETEYRNVQSLHGIGDPSLPPDPVLPEFAELQRWSNFSGQLFDKYHAGAKVQMVEAAQMYSNHVRLRDQIAVLVELLPRVRGELRWTWRKVSVHIQRLAFPETLISPVLTDLALRYLKRQIDDAHDMRTTLMNQIRAVAEAIDWVETVTQNRTPLTQAQARTEHEKNLRAIRHLGTDSSTGRERVHAGALGVATQALSGGDSVAFGRIDRDAGALRKWLANNIVQLADSGARFLLLDLPKVNQGALNDFLDSEGSVTDQDTLFDQLRRNGTPSFGVAADGALIELIRAAHRNSLDVVAGGPMVAPEHVLDRRATAVPYLAAMHNSHAHSGPGIIVTNRYYTNVIDGGLERNIRGLVSIDQADIPPGETFVTPWSGTSTAISSNDPELRPDNSTVVFNPLAR